MSEKGALLCGERSFLLINMRKTDENMEKIICIVLNLLCKMVVSSRR